MKVVLVNTYLNKGGAAIACTRLYHAFSETKTIEATAIHLDEKSLIGKYLSLFRLGIEKLYFIFYQKSSHERFKFSLANTGINISKLQNTKEADVIHLHWINNGFLSLNSLKELAKLKKPIVWTLHDMWAFTGGCHYSGECTNFKEECGNCFFLKNPSDYDLSHSIYLKKKKIFNELNLTIVTCSNWLREIAKESSLLKDETIITIPNPINTEEYKPRSKSILRKKYNLPSDKLIIIFAAANIQDDRKGFLYLMKSLSIMKQKSPTLDEKVELLILGSFKEEGKADLPYPAHFPGYISNSSSMAEYYALSDIFITPSIEDNLPNTIMEAMSCGVPAIAFDTGGIFDMIHHLKNGYLAKLKSSEDMAEGISTLLTNDTLRNEFSEECRKLVLEKFSFGIVAQQYQSLFEKCLEKKNIS